MGSRDGPGHPQQCTLTNAQAKLLKTYYDRFKECVNPQSNEVFAINEFHARGQSNGESFETSVTDLKLLVQDCAYNDSGKMVTLLCLV